MKGIFLVLYLLLLKKVKHIGFAIFRNVEKDVHRALKH